MAVRIYVLYNTPTDPDHFESYYVGTHVPLVEKVPGVTDFQYGKVQSALDGQPTDLFWIATLTFASMEDLGAAMGTPEGAATGEDVPNFATGGVRIILAEA